MAVTTGNGYGQAFHSQAIQNRIVSMKQAQAAISKAEGEKVSWEAEVTKIERMKITPTIEQIRVLKIGIEYFKSVRKTQSTRNMFSINNYSTNFLPPKVEDELDALAWINKVGNNAPKLHEFFPNLANKQLPPVKRVKVYSEDPDIYKEDKTMVRIEGKTKQLRSFEGIGSMVDPLVVLRYCFFCAKYGDELQKVSRKVIGAGLSNKIYKIETKDYIIKLDITANSKKEYSGITVERR